MTRYRGVTLIEVVIFIVVLGITLGSTLRMFKAILTYNNRPNYLLTASQLADARMNLIILQRKKMNSINIADPCSSGTLNACTTLSTFANSKGYIVSSSMPAAVNGVRIVTVTVSGTGNATCVMRFVE